MTASELTNNSVEFVRLILLNTLQSTLQSTLQNTWQDTWQKTFQFAKCFGLFVTDLSLQKRFSRKGYLHSRYLIGTR